MRRIDRLNSIADLDTDQAQALIEAALVIQSCIQRDGHAPDFLRGRCLAMVFDETSLRTRNAFERGMTDLGRKAICFTGEEARLGRKAEKQENLTDFANVIGRFNDALLSRVYDHTIQERLACLSPVPFINGMCDQHHPTQALCDFLTIRRRTGRVHDLKIAFVGDGTNVATSLAQLASLLGSEFAIATPKGWTPPSHLVDGLRGYRWTDDPFEAVHQADAIVTDVWVPMNKGADAEFRRGALRGYQVNQELVRHAKPDAFFMHNLPANRGDEVTTEVIDGPQSAVYEEAVSRLHIARALLLYMLHPDAATCVDAMRR